MGTFSVIKLYLFSFILVSIFTTVQGILTVFLYPLANFLFNKYFIKFVDPLTDFLVGGPTQSVIKALLKVTPFLNSSPLGERLDSILLNFGLGMIGFIANLAASITEQSISYSIQGFTAGVTIAGAVVAGFFDFIFRILDLVGIGASIGTFLGLAPLRLSFTSNPDKGKLRASSNSRSRSSSSSSRIRRSINYPMLVSELSSAHPDAESVLTKAPELRTFLERLSTDEDDCLKYLLCSIESAPEGAATQEEQQLKDKFQSLIRRAGKALSSYVGPFLRAQKLGRKAKTQNACLEGFPKCSSPLLFRLGFNFVQKLKNKIP